MEIPGTRIIGHLRYSGDGRLVMARYLDATLRVWRTADAKLQLTVSNRPLPGGAVLSNDFNDDYDFSPDGTVLALGLPGHGVSLLRTNDGAEVARWEDGPLVNIVRFSPDGTSVVVARTQGHQSREVIVLNARDLSVARRFEPAAAPNTLGWSSEGRHLFVASEDNTLSEFDLRAGRLLARLPLGTHDPVQVLPLDGDRLVATRGVDTNLHLLNPATGRQELVLAGLGSSLLAGRPGGTSFVSSTFDGIATRWDVVSPVGLQIIPSPAPSAYFSSSPPGTLDVSPDGRWVASGHGRYTLIREISSGRFVAEWDAGPDRPMELTTVAFEPDRRALLVCSSLGGLRRHALVPTADGGLEFGPAQLLDAAPGFVMLACSADRHRCVLVNFENGDVKIVDPAAAGAIVRSHWNSPGVYNAALSPDAEKILVNVSGQGPTGASQRIRVHRVADGAVLAELAAHVSCDAAWSSDGRTAVTSNGPAESTLWDTATWRPRARLTGDLGGDSTTFAISPDSRYLVVVKENRVHLISTADGIPFATLEIPDAASLAIAVKFMPDGRRLLVLWPDGRIDLIDPAALHAALAPLGLAW